MSDPLWARLLNSDWSDYRGSGARADLLDDDSWLAGLMAETGAENAPLPDAAGRERLRRLRVLLRGIVDALVAGRPAPKASVTELNAILSASPLVRRLVPADGGWALVTSPSAAGVDRAIGAIAASFAEMLAAGEPRRIKICANADCGWVMYDRSRNNTRRWCDAKECGNLIKVRRFRARKRTAAA